MLPTQLLALRQVIDEIDAKLLELLARRFQATNEIGALKAKYNLTATDPSREIQQKQRFAALAAQNGLKESLVLGIFQEVIAEVVRNHKTIAEGASTKPEQLTSVHPDEQQRARGTEGAASLR